MLPCDVLRLTLDTSCIIHAAQGQHYQFQIDELVNLAREGRVGLWLTSAFHADQIRASGEKLQTNLAWLSARPVVGGFPGPSRLDYSGLGVGDVLASDSDAERDEVIQRILLPEKYRAGNPRGRIRHSWTSGPARSTTYNISRHTRWRLTTPS